MKTLSQVTRASFTPTCLGPREAREAEALGWAGRGGRDGHRWTWGSSVLAQNHVYTPTVRLRNHGPGGREEFHRPGPAAWQQLITGEHGPRPGVLSSARSLSTESSRARRRVQPRLPTSVSRPRLAPSGLHSTNTSAAPRPGQARRKLRARHQVAGAPRVRGARSVPEALRAPARPHSSRVTWGTEPHHPMPRFPPPYLGGHEQSSSEPC